MDGFLNRFAAETIFGADFSLNGMQLANLRCDSFSGRCELELIHSGEVKQPPAKWCGCPWEKVLLRLFFFGVREYHARLYAPDDFTVCNYSVKVLPQKRFVLTLQCENGDLIKLEYTGAQIGNIKPLICDPESHDYTVPAGL